MVCILGCARPYGVGTPCPTLSLGGPRWEGPRRAPGKSRSTSGQGLAEGRVPVVGEVGATPDPEVSMKFTISTCSLIILYIHYTSFKSEIPLVMDTGMNYLERFEGGYSGMQSGYGVGQQGGLG